MQSNLLFQLFQSLNKKELRDLKKFVRSPFHNKREDVIAFFDYLARQWPFDSPQKLQKEFVFAQLFPTKTFDRKSFYHLCSFLKKVIEDYLLYERMRASKVEREIALVQVYRNKSLPRHFSETTQNAISQLQKDPIRNADYHFQNYRLYQEQLHSTISKSRTDGGDLQQATEELTLFYMGQKLQKSCLALSIKSLSNFDFEETFLEEILNYIEQKGYQHSIPTIEVYYHYYKAFTAKESEISFDKLKSLVRKYHQVFPAEEMRYIYLMPINFGIKQFNSGKRDYLREVFVLYQQGLAFDVFLENNTLSRYTYSNIVLAALGLKEFDWAEEFIHQYRAFLKPKYQVHTYNFNLANLYFRKNDYPKAVDLLQKVEFDDLLYNLESRRMLLKIYYAMQETDPLFSLLESFKRFIYRHKVLGYHKESFLNLIRFTYRLLTLRTSNDASRDKLRLEISETQKVADKKWLLEQVAYFTKET